MNRLESLVQISQYYGTNPAYVIAGGGNTSYKNSEKLYIKASGIALSTIDTDGFVVMSRQHLGEMEDKAYSNDPVSREEEVKLDLKKAIICTEHLRTSVETSLHNLIDYAYIVHIHFQSHYQISISANRIRIYGNWFQQAVRRPAFSLLG